MSGWIDCGSCSLMFLIFIHRFNVPLKIQFVLRRIHALRIKGTSDTIWLDWPNKNISLYGHKGIMKGKSCIHLGN